MFQQDTEVSSRTIEFILNVGTPLDLNIFLYNIFNCMFSLFKLTITFTNIGDVAIVAEL